MELDSQYLPTMSSNNVESSYLELIQGNKDWVQATLTTDPDFFERIAEGQSPRFLWIGCSDSRAPESLITNTLPGDIFVHRNIANLVVHTDINMLSVLQYAVEVLKVQHVIVCGHEGCGGVAAACSDKSYGLIDNWLRNIKDVYRLHHNELVNLSEENKVKRMVELNVVEQVFNLCKTTIIQDAWERGEGPHVHGWVYSLADGSIRDLEVTVRDKADLPKIYAFADEP
jgi:carbonic anhydrase